MKISIYIIEYNGRARRCHPQRGLMDKFGNVKYMYIRSGKSSGAGTLDRISLMINRRNTGFCHRKHALLT